MNATAKGKDWQQERRFLVGRQKRWVSEWLGGCPFGQSMVAFSKTLNCEIIMSLPCRRWGCSHCGIVRAADLSRRIVEAAPNKFITLTVSNDNFETPRAAYDETRRRLPKWSAKVRKQLGEFEYCRVLEVTKKGYPHYHLLARCKYIPQKTLSDFWAGLTGSPIVDVRQIRSGQNSVNYVCKYLRKQLYCHFTQRRVSWTKGFFPKTEKPEKTDWDLIDKEHHLQSAADTILDIWPAQEIVRVGPYAVALATSIKQVDEGANEPPGQLVY